jgi:hypothetical protein
LALDGNKANTARTNVCSQDRGDVDGEDWLWQLQLAEPLMKLVDDFRYLGVDSRHGLKFSQLSEMNDQSLNGACSGAGIAKRSDPALKDPQQRPETQELADGPPCPTDPAATPEVSHGVEGSKEVNPVSQIGNQLLNRRHIGASPRCLGSPHNDPPQAHAQLPGVQCPEGSLTGPLDQIPAIQRRLAKRAQLIRRMDGDDS